MEAHKISFQEAWDSTSVFFVDENLEAEIDLEVENLLVIAQDPRISENAHIEVEAIVEFLIQNENGLDVVLRDIELSDEKFMRIVTLMRKLRRISGGFTIDDTEWSLSKIKAKIVKEPDFGEVIARLLINGKNDKELAIFIPRYYYRYAQLSRDQRKFNSCATNTFQTLFNRYIWRPKGLQG